MYDESWPARLLATCGRRRIGFSQNREPKRSSGSFALAYEKVTSVKRLEWHIIGVAIRFRVQAQTKDVYAMNRSVLVAVVAASSVFCAVLATFSAVSAETPDKLGPIAYSLAAEIAQQTPSPQNSSSVPTPTAAPVISAPIGLISPTITVTASTALTAVESAYSEPLSGTIIANRTDYTARYFVEGKMALLEPMLSIGVQLPRVTAVLNLYSCDASAPESDGGCYWDPYLLQRDGFYEVYDASLIDGLPRLMLREADAPPQNQVWIQNRTGRQELLVYKDATYEVDAGAVEQFEVAADAPAIVYVRSCLTLNADTVCEWSPLTLDSGGYFAMVEVSASGAASGSRITTIDLRPVVDAGGEYVAAPPEVVCQAQVPAINVRSGPGLQYEIIGKVREQANEPGRVVVVGRSVDRQWYAVADSVAPGGWVTSSPSFILCTGDAEQLPIVEFSGGTLAATPTPAPVAQAPLVVDDDAAVTSPPIEAVQPETDAPLAEAEQEPEPPSASEEQPAPGIPEGLAMLVVNNGFQFDMRFTIDQQYRPIEGPSEYDLLPGESVSILVYPGLIAFTASSPWNGLSGNSDLSVESDQSITLWLRFEPDQGDSGRWNLAWQ